jgi:membrane fusion protein (multidrug efflux system)
VTQKSLSNSIRQAEIALRELQTNAGKFTVEAPIAGSIGEILVDTGQEVNPGTPLFTITSTSELEIEIGLTSNEVDLIKE